MKIHDAVLISGLALFAAVTFCDGISAQTTPKPPPTAAPKAMTTHHAKGTFEVTVKAAPLADPDAGKTLGRATLDKQFFGDITATGKGEMLTAGSPDGSGAYVAIERVTGTLGGRKGSWVFQHTGVMSGGAPTLTIIVVPGSGTDELVGLAGTFKIDFAGGNHAYDFEYTLAQ